MIYSVIQDVLHGKVKAAIMDRVKALRMRRKWMLREKEHLLFSYQAVLHFLHDFLLQREWVKGCRCTCRFVTLILVDVTFVT